MSETTAPYVMDAPIEDDEEQRVEILDSGVALTAVDKAAIDIQIATARQFPRSITKSLKEATTLATLDTETAESMLYTLTRGKGKNAKVIEGPSARLAEVIAYTWGNLRVEADIVGADKTHVTAMGTCFDLEKNVAVRIRVQRRITDKQGRRYGDDMIGVTSNAAVSIALRNAVFKVVPRSLVDRVYAAARGAAMKQAGTMAQRRQNALEWFQKAGVKDAQVFALLGVAGLDDIGEDHLLTLRGLKNAIKEGEQTVEGVFAHADRSEGASDLNAALGAKAE